MTVPAPHILELFDPSLYIQNFELKGEDRTVTIERVVGGEIIGEDGKKAKKPVVHFSDWPKPLVLGKRTAKTIVALYGTDPRAWAGKRITIYPTREMGFGEMQDVVRVRKQRPAASAPTATAKSPEERVAAFRTSLRTAQDAPALAKAWRLGSALMATLDAATVDSLTIERDARERVLAEMAAEKEKDAQS